MIKRAPFLGLFRPHFLFLVIAMIAGVLFAWITPPLWGLDEPAHFARAYQIANGQMLPNTSHEQYGGTMPENYGTLHWYRGADILDEKYKSGISALQRQDVTDTAAYEKILSQPFSKSEQPFQWTAMYSPLTYPGPVVAICIGKAAGLTMGQTLFLARFLSLVTYVVIGFCALWSVRRFKVAWAFLLAALLPSCLFQASVVSSDGMLISLTLLFLALYTRLLLSRDDPAKNKLIVALLAIAALLPVIKINYVFLSLTVLALPGAYFASKKKRLWFGVLAIMTSVVPGFIWTRLSGATGVPPQSQRQDLLSVAPAEQIMHVITHPIEFGVTFIKTLIIYGNETIVGAFFTISGIGVEMPTALLFILIAAVILAVYYARSELIAAKKQLVYISIGALATCLSIYVAIYAVFNPIGWWIIDGVQGRYFTPFILSFAMVIALLLPVKVTIGKTAAIAMVLSVAVACLTVALAYDFLAFY